MPFDVPRMCPRIGSGHGGLNCREQKWEFTFGLAEKRGVWVAAFTGSAQRNAALDSFQRADGYGIESTSPAVGCSRRSHEFDECATIYGSVRHGHVPWRDELRLHLS